MPTRKELRKATIPDAVEAVGVSEDTVRRDVRGGAPHEKRDGVIYLDIAEYQGWRDEQGRTGKRGRPKPQDTPELAAAKLEKLQEEIRIKRAQADRDERRAEIDQGTHQDLEHLREMLTALGATLRAGVDRMQRRFGPQAAVAFNEILDEFNDLVRKHVGRLGRAGSGGTSPPAADPS